MATRERIVVFLVGFSFCFLIPLSFQETDTLVQGKSIRDGEHLVSSNGYFKLQFFNIESNYEMSQKIASEGHYLGILFSRHQEGYISMKDVSWVANRDNPIPKASGNLMIDSNGTLKISYGNNGLIGLTSVPARRRRRRSNSTIAATLLDTGNFVLREVSLDGSTGQILWQSFDYPTHMLLPGMKIGVNFRTGHNWSLTSWLSHTLPASGSFTLGLDLINGNGTDQLIVWRRGNVFWTSSHWNSYPRDKLEFRFVSNENEKYLTFSTTKLIFGFYYMGSDGVVLGVAFERASDIGCPRYEPFCSIKELPSLGGCVCSSGSGCYRCMKKEKLPDCRNITDDVSYRNYRDVFHGRYVSNSNNGLKLDESHNTTLFDCADKCLMNCSCFAYASINHNGTGCEIWLKGMKFKPVDVSDHPRLIYVVDSKEVFVALTKGWKPLAKWLAITVGGAPVIILLCYLCYHCYIRLTRVIKGMKATKILIELGITTKHKDKKKDYELQVFSFDSIMVATDNFSETNKLGQGGFGPVYKGNFPDGQVIAIKRLSRSSGQGLVEFKKEILLIAKLQHNNLVRLLGCCIEGEEMMLIYEYMSNGSLDYFLFDPNKKSSLDWKKRITIIEGIAQGLLYNHKYARFRIIHRDLKASNILLDEEMNPKISDFGMARIFGENESQAHTKTPVGTYGYMSPEYIKEGNFSIKSDVFSFGVLLLEIISGKKSHGCYHYERPLNLIGYAWELWRENRSLELVEPTLGNSYQSNEVLRCIHVGLLCVQDNPIDRPTMSDVILMLSNEATPLSTPKQPAFFIGGNVVEAETSQGRPKKISINNVTITEMEAR